MRYAKAARWWLAPTAALALIACGGGGDQADAPPLATATQITTGASATTDAPGTTASTTAAPTTDSSTATSDATAVTPGPTTSDAPAAAAPAAAGSVTPSGDATHRWPTTVSGRRILDQVGDPYLLKAFSSWGMAQNLTDAEITDALERLAGRGFNAVNVAPNGVGMNDQWVKYENVAGQPFFTGTPFASPLGPGWATMDHIVSEAERLGMTVLVSFFVSWDTSGIQPDLVAVTDRDAYDYGVAVASRYRDAPNVAWHLMADTEWEPGSDIGRRVDNLFHGITDTETTPRLIFAEPTQEHTGYSAFMSHEGTGDSAYQWLHLSANSVYDYGDDAVEQFDAVWDEKGATDVPVWDSEPPYASAPHYSGDQRQQLRERNYSTFIRGGSGINYGDEDWWRFGIQALYDGGRQWFEVPDSDTTVDAQHAWALIDAHVADPTWTRDDGAFLVDGLGSGDTKAASGSSRSSGLVYVPDGRSITVDLSVFGADVHVRWYDPTTGDSTDVGEFTNTGVLPIAPPGDNASGQPDWVLVVEQSPP